MTDHLFPVGGISKFLCAAAALAGLAGCDATRAGAHDAAGSIRHDPKEFTVVELFQSQGCSSCPPANANINRIADRPGLIVLSFSVTYWDRLGWKDTFARPEYTRRQQDYASRGSSDGVYTPQVVLNGRAALIGGDMAELRGAIDRAGTVFGGPVIETASSKVRLGGGTASGPADVWLVRFDPASREVAIRAGENTGRTLPHRHIVRELVKLGQWNGKPVSFDLPGMHEPGLAAAVLVQRGAGGPIVSARPI